MSVTLNEVLLEVGYDITNYDDAVWLLSKKSEFEGLVEEAEKTVNDRELQDE